MLDGVLDGGHGTGDEVDSAANQLGRRAMKTGLWNACGLRSLVQGTHDSKDPSSRDLSAGDAVSTAWLTCDDMSV